MRYRSDIEGLRALAILLVIFNHINLTWFSGGFIGVDVFFVISGFLITKILHKDISNHQFSLGNFYKKRIIRLAPALFTVLTVVSVTSYFIMLPNELMEYSKSLIYSTFLLANIYMRKEAGDYFSGSVDEIPLLHLWSLGVEEQFYLVWPLLLLLLFKRSYSKYIIWIILGCIALSVFYAEQQIIKSAAKAYYRMPVRACELLLGALIYFLPLVKFKKIYAQISIALSLGVISYCAVSYNQFTTFPGINAMIPCIATGIIIYLGKNPLNHNFLLSNPINSWIGKLSYPMYLWHWPIVVFFNFYYIEFNWTNQLFIVCLTIVLSYLTYTYIEDPSKKWLNLPNKTVILKGFVAPSLIFTMIVACTYQFQGFPNRYNTLVSKQVLALQAAPHRARQQCHDSPNDERKLPNPDICRIGIEKDHIDFIVLGDSHANSMIGAIDVWAKDAGLRGYDPTHTATMYMPDVDRYYAANQKDYHLRPEYKTRNDAITAHLNNHQYDFVIFAGYYSLYLDTMFDIRDGQHTNREDVLKNGLRRAFNNISQSTDKIFVILDVPELKGIRANCPARVESIGVNQSCTQPIDQIQARDAKTLKILFDLQKEFPQIKFIDPKKVICKEATCSLSLNQTPLYVHKDKDHLNYVGSAEIGSVYLHQFGNPFNSF
ncbi:acyltransferase family protein [Acinetobacter sp. ANC 5414]|uniref:acyltransferase family protein n=1 Tax=Acinetobacter sp. ANC 5414 TaxID=2731251 RepID=UPI0014903D57|nr:acyltransferase family protein [Acinetobacter sp. ANC 5414]NNH02259.1 acyltransferase [Acinetobacter sp. ANC 5414]